MNELLPCPFCGGEAEMLTAESMHGGNLYGVMCDCCACRTDVYDTEAEAVAAWNTRAERTCYSEYPDRWECSECGFLDAYTTADFINYCPNCGAKVVS